MFALCSVVKNDIMKGMNEIHVVDILASGFVFLLVGGVIIGMVELVQWLADRHS